MLIREQTLEIPGPAGKLQAVVSYPEKRLLKPIAVICHPHPLFEGSMDNKVVHRLVKIFLMLGMIAVRFNFRGVGQSAGQYGGTEGETQDLFSVMDWLNIHLAAEEYCLAGFSFGGYIAYRGAATFRQREEIKMLISVAPAVVHFDFFALPKLQCPWIVVQGEQDEIVNPDAVYLTLNRLAIPHTLITLSNTGHFFHGQLLTLQHKLLEALTPYTETWQIAS